MGSDIKLKPCPFCGGEAKIIHANDVTLPYRIRCKNINCDVRPSTTWFKYEEDAITKWNTRKPMDEIVEQLEDENKTAVDAAIIFHGEYFNGVVDGLEKAIEIVRGCNT